MSVPRFRPFKLLPSNEYRYVVFVRAWCNNNNAGFFLQNAAAAAERSRAEAQAAKERELRDLDESARRRIETIQSQSEARWREAEAESERLRESLRRAEREALREQQALLNLHTTGYDNAAMSPSSGSPERDQNSPDWLVARQKSNDLRGQHPVASKSGVEERWARVYETLHKLNSELAS